MTLKDKVCDLLDIGEKGYITIGDIGWVFCGCVL